MVHSQIYKKHFALKLRNQVYTKVSGSSSSKLFYFIHLQTAAVIVNPVVLSKEKSVVFNAIILSDRDKAKCVMVSCELKTVISVQRSFRTCYNKEPTHRSKFYRCCKQFADAGSIKKRTRPGRRNIKEPIYLDKIENSSELLLLFFSQIYELDDETRLYFHQDRAPNH